MSEHEGDEAVRLEDQSGKRKRPPPMEYIRSPPPGGIPATSFPPLYRIDPVPPGGIPERPFPRKRSESAEESKV